MSETRYLVYKSWNGQVHASIEHGDHHTGEGAKKDDAIIKKFKISKDHNIIDLKMLTILYPLEDDNK